MLIWNSWFKSEFVCFSLNTYTFVEFLVLSLCFISLLIQLLTSSKYFNIDSCHLLKECLLECTLHRRWCNFGTQIDFRFKLIELICVAQNEHPVLLGFLTQTCVFLFELRRHLSACFCNLLLGRLPVFAGLQKFVYFELEQVSTFTTRLCPECEVHHLVERQHSSTNQIAKLVFSS